MSYPMIEIGDLMLKRNGSVDPSKFPDETFELHSIPAFDKGTPDIVKGSEIGSSKQLVQENDVMISKIVPHIRRASVVCPKGDYRQIASGEWIVFRSDKIYPDYLKHVLISDTFNKQFMATVSGVGGSLLRARPAFVAKIKIALPPLAEQRRIASILDQADELRQKRQQAIEKLDQLLQSTFIEMFGDPVSNPKGFLLVKLEDLVNKPITYGVLKPEEYTENGIPMLRIQDINTKKNLSHLTDFHLISNELSNQYKRTILNGHEIVISLVGTIGLVAKIPEEFKGFNIHRNLGVIDLCDKSLVDYILYFMKMPEFLILLERISKGGVHKLLNLADLRAFEFPIPPKDLQEKWSKIALSIEDQKQKLYKQLDMQNQLFSSLQNQAFNGTL